MKKLMIVFVAMAIVIIGCGPKASDPTAPSTLVPTATAVPVVVATATPFTNWYFTVEALGNTGAGGTTRMQSVIKIFYDVVQSGPGGYGPQVDYYFEASKNYIWTSDQKRSTVGVTDFKFSGNCPGQVVHIKVYMGSLKIVDTITSAPGVDFGGG